MPTYRVRYRAKGALRDGEEPITTWVSAENPSEAAKFVRSGEPDVSYILDVIQDDPLKHSQDIFTRLKPC